MQTKLVLKQQSALKLRFQSGATGPAGTITVGNVTTGAPGSDADVTNTGTSQHAILDFTIPRGDVGAANSLAIGTVTTGAPGSSASAAITGTPPSQTLSLTIPRGDVGATGPAVGDGDKGDIVVSSSGTVWTVDSNAVTTAKINNDAVTNAKLANVATATIKGRVSAGTGDPEDLTPAQARAVSGALGAEQGGFRNLIINGDFRVNARTFAGGALSAGAYGHDRWKADTGGANYTVSGRVATIASGTIVQIIDGTSIKTGTYVINWTGTATCTVDGVAKTKGATFSLTAGTNCTVKFTGGTVSEAQVEYGAVPTTFELRPVGVEFLLCQHFYRISRFHLAAYAPAGEAVATQLSYPTMRTAPTAQYISDILLVNATGLGIDNITNQDLRIYVSTITTGRAINSAIISLDAEL